MQASSRSRCFAMTHFDLYERRKPSEESVRCPYASHPSALWGGVDKSDPIRYYRRITISDQKHAVGMVIEIARAVRFICYDFPDIAAEHVQASIARDVPIHASSVAQRHKQPK